MTELPRTYKRPVHEATLAIDAELRRDSARLSLSRRLASVTLNTLRDLGFITTDGLAAIHAEEEANGQPRSVLPRYAPPAEPETR